MQVTPLQRPWPLPVICTGTQVRRLSAQEVKQIAGRAGRFRSSHPTGHVTCLHQDDVHLLHEALATRASPLEAACLMPRWGSGVTGQESGRKVAGFIPRAFLAFLWNPLSGATPLSKKQKEGSSAALNPGHACSPAGVRLPHAQFRVRGQVRSQQSGVGSQALRGFC